MAHHVNLAACINSRKCIYSQGAAEGVLAGIVFAAAEMLMNLALGESVFGPLRLIASVVLGREALRPDFPLMTAAFTGVVVHLLFSILFGIIFLYLLKALRVSRPTTSRLLVYGSIYGFVLWLINFYVIAPMAFPQFLQANQFWNGFIAHTFFYGAFLGLYLQMTRPEI